MKKSKRLERHFKGAANHYRIEILLLLDKKSEMTLEKITDAVRGNIKTIGEHTRRLYLSGLIDKKYEGRFVSHRLSPYGRRFVSFIKKFK